ncbi:MAG TPA: hypothetical protein DD613_04930 [Firmicutes bacterium]|nr:hypothetical protein [Bacillota bacterium]
MRKVLNKNKLFYFVMISLILVVIIVIGVKFTLEFLVKDDKNVVTKKELDSLELYGYTLDDYDSDLYKEYFNDLKGTLNSKEVNYEDYAKEIVKLFVSDFYTLDNKLTSSDIGGVEFIPSDMVENFKMHAGDTMYNHVKTNIYGDRVQKLPIVKSVEVTNIENITYTYKDKEYSAYKVSARWEYQEDLGYKNNEIFTLIKDNNKLYIVVGE